MASTLYTRTTTSIVSRPGPSTRLSLALGQCSSFSTSASKSQLSSGSHYTTLGVPQNASRMEIKAAYFRLSKKFHPDTRTEHGEHATDSFHKISEAYSTLSDDRKRRAYDRTMLESMPESRHSSVHHRGTSAGSDANRWTQDIYERRKRGATHAWEGPRGYRAHQYPYQNHPHANRQRTAESTGSSSSAYSYTRPGGPSGGYSYSGPQPLYSKAEYPGVGKTRLSGRERREEAEREAHDRLTNTSTLGRFFSGLGILLVVSWVGGFGHGGGG